MEIRGKTICGRNAVQLRNVFREFLEIKNISFDNGEIKRERKVLNADFIARELGLTRAEGEDVLVELINDGYIDKDLLTPTRLGMALINSEDRDRLPLCAAKKLLHDFLDAVKEANAKPGARVLIDRVYVFGSYHEGTETVGDIDLLIEAPLPDDCEPEDMEELDAIIEKIRISDYLSFHNELDLVAAQANKCIVYDRAKAP